MILAISSSFALANDDVKLSAQQQKDLSYLMGYQLAKSLNRPEFLTIMSLDKQEVLNGLNDALNNKAARINEQQQSELDEAFMYTTIAYNAKIAQENLTKGEQFLAQNKTQAGVHTTESGLQYRMDKTGSGARVKLGDTVSVFYTGKLLDGTVFDQTDEQPLTVNLSEHNLIAGWVEGLQLMQKGGEYTLFIPANLAYGENSVNEHIKSNAMLIFEIKVADIQAAPSKKPTKKTSSKAKRR